jgi:hypothetical protein
MTIVAAGVPTASAVVPPLPMTSLGLHLQPERVKVLALACLPSLWIRAKFALLLVSPLSLLPLAQFWFGSMSPKLSDVCSCRAVGLYVSYFTVVVIVGDVN